MRVLVKLHRSEPSVCVSSYVADEDVRLREEVTDEKRNAGKESAGDQGYNRFSLEFGDTPLLSHTHTRTNQQRGCSIFSTEEHQSSKVGHRKCPSNYSRPRGM